MLYKTAPIGRAAFKMSQYGFKMQQLSPNARPSEALYNLDFKIIYTMKYRLDYLICFAFA